MFFVSLVLDLSGSAIALMCAYFTKTLGTLVYIVMSGVCKECWEGWSMECLKDWGQMLKLGIPGMLMEIFKAGSFTTAMVLTGTVTIPFAVTTLAQQLKISENSNFESYRCQTMYESRVNIGL